MTTTTANPFTDPDLVNGTLYASADRLASRTTALHRARVSGRHAGLVIADLAEAALQPGAPALIADLGCGRGTTTQLLTAHLPAATVVTLDLSHAMLTTAREKLAAAPGRSSPVRADFHHLPFRDSACDMIVAAFCLYHSPHPQHAAGEIARCLRPDGTAVIAVKSRDSYRELDQLIAASGLDTDALSRPSLYQSAHTTNIADIIAGSLTVGQIIHDTHRFTFPDLAAAAQYLITSPKYRLPGTVRGGTEALAIELRRRLPDRPVTTTSVVTYVIATRRGD
jgi:SAM-dependent methyltransferase